MVYCHTKNPNLCKKILERFGKENVGKFFGHLECLKCHLVYFMDI
jgi:hypothetical protein